MIFVISRIIIENVKPILNDGEKSIKRICGETVRVSADIFSHGHEIVKARIAYKHESRYEWRYSEMKDMGNDTWEGSFTVSTEGTYIYTVEAWSDTFTLWLNNIAKWKEAGENIAPDLLEGILLIREKCHPRAENEIAELEKLLEKLENGEFKDPLDEISRPLIYGIITKNWAKDDFVSYEKELTVEAVEKARIFRSWYEMFPRSQGTKPNVSGTFRDCINRLPDIADMGFDLIYLTPIHPIGITNRRGKNGSKKCEKGDPGSPWAIGNEKGGHKSINPDLGTMDDFLEFVNKARGFGIDIAMDIAFQCSPDHPYVKEHPEWFRRRIDGSIRYAENPPKRYYDIYPLDFDTRDKEGLWNELKSIFIFWAEKGIRVFRVDNPHTKPFDFWEWILKEVKREFPDTVFLAEAFTRPKVMYELSKIGFTLSYSYFTWRNFNYEIMEYFREIESYPISEHFWPVLFTNTPDILTENLRVNGRPAFIYRAFLAATLSPSWGIYSGYELCENAGIEGTEEYLNSEKYEIKVRDWNSTGNIKGFISSLNGARRENPVFSHFGNTTFLETGNPNIVAYLRTYEDSSALMLVNINPREAHTAYIDLPPESLGIRNFDSYILEDLLTKERMYFHGNKIIITLYPEKRAGMVLVRV